MQPDLIVAIGILFSVGLFADYVGRKTKIPRVTLLLGCGITASALDMIPAQLTFATETITVLALTMVAFLLGGSFRRDELALNGKTIVGVSISIILATLLIVTLGLYAFGIDPIFALLLASIATATAPAATLDVIRQSGVTNKFTRSIQGIVAVDDAWGLLVFSVCLAMATQLTGGNTAPPISVMHEVGGAAILGIAIGLPAAFLTGRIEDGEPLMIEALSIAFLTAGLATYFAVSFLMSGMMAGAIVANLAPHHRRAFHEIEHIQWPFMIVFFVLAGAALDVGSVRELGVLGMLLVVLRVAARLLGGWIGAVLARAPKADQRLYGVALLPQAGVAIGMALLAGQALPQWRDQIMALTIGTTVVFELIGPVLTMWAIKQSAKS